MIDDKMNGGDERGKTKETDGIATGEAQSGSPGHTIGQAPLTLASQILGFPTDPAPERGDLRSSFQTMILMMRALRRRRKPTGKRSHLKVERITPAGPVVLGKEYATLFFPPTEVSRTRRIRQTTVDPESGVAVP